MINKTSNKYPEPVARVSILLPVRSAPLFARSAALCASACSLPACVLRYVGPFHGSNAFLTAHAAFTLELELAMQAVDPAVTQPYWDFTVDAAALGHDWQASELFG